MLRLAGFLLIFLGCAGMGAAAGEGLRLRVVRLEELRHMLKLLSSEIRCAHSALPEAFARTGRRVKRPFSEFLLYAAGRMEQGDGESLPEIFEEAVSQETVKKALCPEDRELLRELGVRLGALDVENQLGSLELSLQKAWDQEKKAREEYQNKSRVFRYLGALGGLFLIVLFL